MGHTRHGTDCSRSSLRRSSHNYFSPRPAGGGYRSRHRRRSSSPRPPPPRGPAASRPWHNNGRNFTAPNSSNRQYEGSRYGHQHAEGASPGTLGEITNQSPLPSPGFGPGPSRPLREDDEDSLFIGDGLSSEYLEEYAEPDPEPLPRPLPKTRPTENQDERSEFPEAYRRRPEPIADSKIASGMYFPAIGKPILKPLPAKPNAAQSRENVLKPRYISTTGIPIEASTTHQESASKKPVTGPLSKRSVSFKPAPSNTDTSKKPPVLSKASALSKTVASPTPGTSLPPKPPAFRVRFLADDSPEPSVSRLPSTSTNLATSGSANQEPQQSVHTHSLKPNLQLPDQPKKPESKPDSKPVSAPNRSIRNRRAGDPFLPEDLKIIWNNCFGQRQPPDASRLGHFALPIPSHSLHLVSPAQIERATCYVLSNIVRFDLLPLQLHGGEKSPLPDEVTIKMGCLDPAQAKGQQQTTSAYHKLQLRPSMTLVDSLGWAVLRSMQVAWELAARWYKEVIVDGGWNMLSLNAHREPVSMHTDGDAMDIDDEDNGKNNKHDDINNSPTGGTGLGDFFAAELRRNVMKTKLGHDEPKGSTDIDLEIGRWMDQIGRGLI